MRKLARLACAMALASASACIQAPVRVTTEATPGVDFSSIRSFAQVPPPWPHPIVGERVEREIPRVLAAKALRQAEGDVIEASQTRPYLIRALELLRTKQDSNPSKKHGNLPL